MKIERALLFVLAAGAAISINAQTTSTTVTTSNTTSSMTATTTSATAKTAGKPAATPAPPAPKTPAELHQLDSFVGSWQCTGKNPATPLGPEKVTAARVDASWEFGGHWLLMKYTEAKTAANPTPLVGAFHQGWDSDQKKYASLWNDNMGGYQVETSTGWDGDKLTWEGPFHAGMGEAVDAQDIFTRVSATRIMHSSQLNLKGTWTKLDEETCTKITPKAPTKK